MAELVLSSQDLTLFDDLAMHLQHGVDLKLVIDIDQLRVSTPDEIDHPLGCHGTITTMLNELCTQLELNGQQNLCVYLCPDDGVNDYAAPSIHIWAQGVKFIAVGQFKAASGVNWEDWTFDSLSQVTEESADMGDGDYNWGDLL